MARKGQKFINYSVEFKLLAVKKYLRRQCFFLQLTDLLSCMGGGNYQMISLTVIPSTTIL